LEMDARLAMGRNSLDGKSNARSKVE